MIDHLLIPALLLAIVAALLGYNTGCLPSYNRLRWRYERWRYSRANFGATREARDAGK